MDAGLWRSQRPNLEERVAAGQVSGGAVPPPTPLRKGGKSARDRLRASPQKLKSSISPPQPRTPVVRRANPARGFPSPRPGTSVYDRICVPRRGGDIKLAWETTEADAEMALRLRGGAAPGDRLDPARGRRDARAIRSARPGNRTGRSSRSATAATPQAPRTSPPTWARGPATRWPGGSGSSPWPTTSPWLTALGNDYCFDDVFVRPLQNYARPGDVLIGSSVSGSSPNLVRAFEWARQNGLRTIALVGAKRGPLAELAEQTLVIDDTHYGRVEDAQMTIYHMLCYAFMEGEAK